MYISLGANFAIGTYDRGGHTSNVSVRLKVLGGSACVAFALVDYNNV